ncbi:MAG: isocitrate/isopropylmalate dehydrogenase family protein [Aigarchaeota archaeon]|nr:isocitrate/isopropylmalate dehydrogenase family protein [Aigarchaeota archaeon]MCX8192766.1 isocitrate/isopropylmalate dehydrogenase family protein [Nitrososphaeria archaeon]MDW7986013.1 isocitrate/isopropylmalate dehydrogenase family protein [Nitrososphaerota archaeon]
MKVSVIYGDGIGPKVVSSALRVLEEVSDLYGLGLEFIDAPAGDNALRDYGEALPKHSLEKIVNSDACFKGPIGETARDVIVFLRQYLDLYANIRPFKTFKNVKSFWRDIDFVIVRENTEDLYRSVEDLGPDHAVALLIITRRRTERIARVAFDLAYRRRKKVTIVHKGNVLRSYAFFRDIAVEVGRRYSGVVIEDMYVDNVAYQLIVNPSRFDILLTPNMFGDILSDEAAGLIGSIGLTSSANISEEFGLFEPVHGSAPDINPEYANPLGQILTASMMLEWISYRKERREFMEASKVIREAVEKVLEDGDVLTPDLGGSARTDDVTLKIIRYIKKKLI